MSDRQNFRSDLYLIAGVFLIAVMAVGMMLTGHVLINMIDLAVTLLLLLMTYFFGLIVGLGGNLVFIFAQSFYMVYLHLAGHTVPVVLGFWLLLPALLCLTFNGVTQRLRQIQADNVQLRENMVEHGAFDRQTNLRTTVAYLEDAAVYVETGTRFKIPVATVIIKIRYFNDLKQMLGAERIDELITVTLDTLKAATRDNDITYILNSQDPTWAVLLYSDADGAQIAADRIREFFEKQLVASKTLGDVDLRLKLSVVQWDPQKMQTATDMMNAGLKELEYDV
ncbi:GGDEF domain-containing protein [Lacticaseibacillus sp. N501-2]|uniref:GGDEF domain-containing protein n=1 Tax=Lacticaseibacillus salsurae TaxID=3367729 RepID=UPI0038B38C29